MACNVLEVPCLPVQFAFLSSFATASRMCCDRPTVRRLTPRAALLCWELPSLRRACTRADAPRRCAGTTCAGWTRTRTRRRSRTRRSAGASGSQCGLRTRAATLTATVTQPECWTSCTAAVALCRTTPTRADSSSRSLERLPPFPRRTVRAQRVRPQLLPRGRASTPRASRAPRRSPSACRAPSLAHSVDPPPHHPWAASITPALNRCRQ